jgi:hypothetical protein
MKMLITGFGEVAEKGSIAPGDVFLFKHGSGHFLVAMRVETQVGFNAAVVLADLTGPAEQELPSSENFDLIVQDGDLVRKLTDGLVIEPADPTSLERFADLKEVPMSNGVLALFAQGSAIYVRPEAAQGAFVELTSGKIVRRPLPHQKVHWRLTWREGDKELELFNSVKPPIFVLDDD